MQCTNAVLHEKSMQLLTSSNTLTVFLQLCRRVMKLDVVGEL